MKLPPNAPRQVGQGGRLTVVGDDDQSIFSFQVIYRAIMLQDNLYLLHGLEPASGDRTPPSDRLIQILQTE